ncbi:hypothetical protein A3D66_01110 [Candidatus Kaiserbacteria bacterium RIFCSPHIGHO2_02_FULL_50_9]|uniref:Bifunctional glucose-6-phosphate/mannose-6-phosphate isomerase C-terminal domain-containing protein n=1 Tax=Candidatus Kaiserbacteria bacterium RIFCSPLOWO2_01_FULL_51_21 TaxID=1798508 RepID=A0A1F6EDU9_9BACT|nr:MAG: hypothetical protein A2761_01645 [Candidatus Kaiserbacteria bacterium RIFCSPHIGHO2_01_FULL_51_33]OGG63497.1 MAG: hypothetical protein A3D66_01110 [Candidatus Kaiserbacteria bacterium RIFCSPHIGHO2_02_FULL_50_9]OGG71811.1 MAG: hypothetical protein A3A35_02730 [Candidatus Kaiserbacteria bacterium RIFCSPLOWO2_01_FULL_51_21]
MIPQELIAFPNQFSFQPIVENQERLRKGRLTVVGGMGGSALVAGLLNTIDPALGFITHRDYGLPLLPEALFPDTLFIASSASGNTEETLDFARTVENRGFSLAVIAGGGELLNFALKRHLTLVKLPHTSLPPRMSTGYLAIALAALTNAKNLVANFQGLSHTLSAARTHEEGRVLAQSLAQKVPLIYASTTNFPLAYYWKITFNETAKIPAFCTSVPEMSHNEIEGFDGRRPSFPSKVIFLVDTQDHPRILKRMSITQELYRKQNVETMSLSLHGEPMQKIFGSVHLAIATSLSLAGAYGNEAIRTPLISSLKERMKD